MKERRTVAKLASAEFEIGHFDEAAQRSIAQGVNASSAIEGEEIPASMLELVTEDVRAAFSLRVDSKVPE